VDVSNFAKRMMSSSGIGRLMDDLAGALATPDEMIMLGGGNPAAIPEVETCLQKRLQSLAANPADVGRLLGFYDFPQGHAPFIEAMCHLLQREFDWPVTPENMVLTNGSQSAFFALFNMFAGTFPDACRRRILFPLAPEYIGYTDMGIEPDMFTARKPRIERLDNALFKYHVDFEHLQITEDIGALCVSRPTNPTGNVLTDIEINKLADLAAERGIPLLVDNAYGAPFPHILYTEVRPVWNEQMVVCMSLSKLGLPAARTGIVVAAPEIAKMLARLNAVVNLSPGGIGAALVTDLLRSNEILRLARDVIQPYYRQKVDFALEAVRHLFAGQDMHIHKPEGAFFLWLWFPSLKIPTEVLYRRLKARGVIVVPGEYFYPGLDEAWEHKHQCLRVNIAQPPDKVERGLAVIAEEVQKAS
jgi:valine--pyruvate aminotransferase